MLYLTLEAALLRAKERAGISGTAEDAFLTELLQLSAGTDPEGTTHYRPFLVAARWLEQNQSAQAISKADGVEFTGLRTPIASLLNLQAGYDMACNLTVPDGMGATLANRSFRIQGSRSQPTQIRP